MAKLATRDGLRRRAWVVMAALGPIGCSTCGDHAVPFKRGAEPEQRAAVHKDAATPPPGTSATVAAAQVLEGHSYPDATARIDIAGKTLELAGGAAIRAALELPAAEDDSPSVLLVTTDKDGAAAFEHAQRQAKSWAAPQRVVALFGTASGASCKLKSADIRGLDKTYVLVSAELACGSAKATAPPAPAQATAAPVESPAQLEHHTWIATFESAPRVLEHVATLGANEPGTPQIASTLESRDLDGDGHPDLLLGLDVGPEGQPPTRVEIELFNRAGGLARDTAEPEKTLLAIADQSKTERRRNPALARQLAERALLLHRALCRGGSVPRFYFGGSRGLDCGASLGAGRAASVVTALLASDGKLLEALESLQALQQPIYRLTDNDWERARLPLRSRVDDHGYVFRPGPPLEPSAGLRVRRAPIAFIDESHLLLRGASPRSLDLGSGALEPSGIPAETTITDPSGHLAIGAILRSCEGYRLSIVRTAQIVAGVAAGQSVAEPLFAHAEPPAGAHCPELTREQRSDEGGFRVLDWTAQGVLIARANALWLLPLDASGAAVGEARALGPTDPTPPLVRSGELTADGRFLALLTPLGIAIHDRKQGTTRLLAAPDAGGPITDVALSPSGAKLALVQGQKLLIGTPREQPDRPVETPPGPTPTAPSAPVREPPPAPPGTPATLAPQGH